MKLSITALFTAMGIAQAQDATDFTDPATGICFQTFSHTSGFKFGVALPATPSGDLIGYLAGPKSVAWGGGDLGASMVGKVLIVAWPNGNEVVGSTRLATRKSNPAEYTANITLKAIPKGTFVKDGNWQYTFVCGGCLKDEAKGFKKEATEGKLGFALSATAPRQPANKASALNYHAAGFGAFNAKLSAARSDKFEGWSKVT